MAEFREPTQRDAKSALTHDIWRHQQPLQHFFQPQNVALIGATEAAGSVGRTILRNLISSPFGGTVFPVNPKRGSVLGIKAYPTVEEVPAQRLRNGAQRLRNGAPSIPNSA